MDLDLYLDLDLDLDSDLDLVLVPDTNPNPVPFLDAQKGGACNTAEAVGVASASRLSVQERDRDSD